LHVLHAKLFSVVSIQIFRVKNANPSFYAKHVENNYFPLPSKFKMNLFDYSKDKQYESYQNSMKNEIKSRHKNQT
jgi:hypothetical protein